MSETCFCNAILDHQYAIIGKLSDDLAYVNTAVRLHFSLRLQDAIYTILQYYCLVTID